MKNTFVRSIMLILLLILGKGLTLQAAPPGKPASVEDIYRLVNKYRQGKGLGTLKLNDAINKEAARHSRNMATNKVPFGHEGFNDRFDRLAKAIPGATSMAENVEYTTGDAAHVVDNWVHSPMHRKNMEGNYNLTGIGVAVGQSGQVYYTEIFIKN